MGDTETVQDELAELKAILSHTTSNIVLVDCLWRVRLASSSALESMGLSEDQARGKDLRELDLPAGIEDIVGDAVSSGEDRRGEVSQIMDGVRRYFVCTASPVSGGETGLVVVTLLDITTRRTVEKLGEVMDRVYATINSAMSFDEIMQAIIEQSSQVMDSEASAISIKEGDRWVLRYRFGAIPAKAVGGSLTEEQMRSTFMAADGCTTGTVDIRKTSWVSEEIMGRFDMISFISLPLRFRGVTIGLLIFAFTRPREFSAEEVNFATNLSGTLSLALENANLFQEERGRRSLLQTILDNVPAVIILMSADLKIKWVNKFSDRFKFGEYTDLNTVGFSLADIIPSAPRSGVEQLFRQVVETGTPFQDNEFMLTGLGDRVIYWRGSLIPMAGSEPGPPDLLILAVDVTENVEARKKSEELAVAADNERRRLRTILDTLPTAAAIFDRDGRVVEINPAARTFWSSIIPSLNDVKDLGGVQARNADTGEPLRPEDWAVSRAISHGDTTLNQLVVLKGRGEKEITMLSSATPLHNEKGEVLGAVALAQDVTEQISLQREVVEARSRAELYVDLLTHDINNLNAVALGYLQLMKDRAVLEEKVKVWTMRSFEALKESSHLIENIRKLQKLESGGGALALVDLDKVLGELTEEMGKRPPHVAVLVTEPRERHCVIANDLVREVFANLVDNSFKHNPGPVEMVIRVGTVTESGRPMHKVDVEDNGIGVPDQDKENIFERSWRGRTKATGKGLGLYLVRRLVEGYGGRVWVEDRVPGDRSQGARFVVLLPSAECQ